MTSRRGWRAAAAALTGLVLLVGTLGPATGRALADDLDNQRAQKQAQIDANDQKQAELEAQLEDLSGDLAQKAADLAAAQGQLPAAQAALDEANAQVATAEREATLAAARLTEAQNQETELAATIESDDTRREQIRTAIGQMAREAYRGGGDLSGLEVVLDSTDSQDFVDRYGQMSTALRTQAQVLDELEQLDSANRNAQVRLAAVRDRIAELKAAADAALAEAKTARQAAADAKSALDTLVAQIADQQAALEGQKSDLQAQLDEADAARAALASDLAAIVAAQEEQRRQAAAAAAAAGGKAPADVTVTGAVFVNPSATDPIYVTSEYGMRLHPILHIWRLHAGIDLRDYCNQPVYAGRAGTVQWAKYRSGYGNQVLIDHGWVNGASLMSSYNHLTRWVVSAGQQVSTGQLIGYAGNTGTSAACHLHFEVYVNGATTNPRPYLGI